MITCFMVQRNGRSRRYLRRSIINAEDTCSVHGHCQARNLLDEITTEFTPKGAFKFYEPKDWPLGWPKACDCGKEFLPEHYWRVDVQELWTDGKGIWEFSELPLGAMWWQKPWHENVGSIYFKASCREHMLNVKTPGGEWNIDRPSQGGTGWQWSGTPPIVTATPSCHCDPPSGWHGWLENGILRPA